MEPRLTVVIPIYNRSREVERLMQTLLSQDMDDAEFLFIDDGSTDDTAKRIRFFLPKDSRLRLITKQNSGTGDTRNQGIRASRGKWLFFLDSDDAIPFPTTLSKLVDIAESEHVQIAGGSTQFEKRGTVIPSFMGWPEPDSSVLDSRLSDIGDLTQEPFEYFIENGVFPYADYQYDAGFSRFIYLKELLTDHDIKFPCTTFYEDPLFFVRAMDAAQYFAAVPEPTYTYRLGWHPVRCDYKFCQETLLGFKSNLVFSKERGYSRLHRITYERFRKFNAVELALTSDTYSSLKQLVQSTYEAFDPHFVGADITSEEPASISAINRFGTPEWNSAKARFKRFRRLETLKIKNAVKCNPLFLKLEELGIH